MMYAPCHTEQQAHCYAVQLATYDAMEQAHCHAVRQAVRDTLQQAFCDAAQLVPLHCKMASMWCAPIVLYLSAQLA